jgi:NNP family nitrate/nitrite transporter-like MFS transporter
MDDDSKRLGPQIGFVSLLTGIFFLNFLSRIILAPLLPTVEKDLGIGHGEAGSLFFMISLGYFIALMGSGFISSRFTHRKTIIFSPIALGAALLAVSFSETVWQIRIGLFMVGMAAGIYLPSGISTITSLVRNRDWGKAMAIHELAPNISFLVAPLIAEALIIWFPWRYILAIIGIISVLAGLAFVCFGKGGDFPGKPPSPSTLKILFTEPSFWIMIGLFSAGIATTLGVYTMLPLYLVVGHGIAQSYANHLVALSRISGLGIGVLSGLVADKFGAKITMRWVLLGSGLATIAIGLTSGWWLAFVVFLQPLIGVCFFPPGFSVLSRIGPASIRNVAVSFTMPVAFFVGGGMIPAMIGIFGEKGYFPLGFLLTGAMISFGFIIANYLRLSDD